MENKEIYYTRVLPMIKYSNEWINGKLTTVACDNLTSEEIKSIPISCARMLWEDANDLYIAEIPLKHDQGASVKFQIVYLFDELSDNDQEKYFDRTIILPLTKKGTVEIYGEESKCFFPKRRQKIKEEK